MKNNPASSQIKKKEPRSELFLRVVSALVLATVVLFLTWYGSLPFFILAGVGALLIYYEVSIITRPNNPLRIEIFGAAFLILLLIVRYLGVYQTELIVLVCAAVGLAIWGYSQKRACWSALGLVYAYIPFWAVTQLRESYSDGLLLVLCLFAIVWGADIAAYFVGRAIGGPKLAPSISPGKTWSGFFGGLAGSLILATIVVMIGGYKVGAGFVVLVVVVSIASQVGDLFESWIKRKFNVKDSSQLIPGHGGLLDRIDGLIFGAFLMAIYGWATGGFPLSI